MLLCPTWELLVREPPGLEGLPSLAGVQSRHLIHPVVSSSWRLGRDSREHGGGRPATALCSSGFHYVWQSLGLCVLEGSGLITHGGGSGFSLAVAVYTLENPLEWQGGKFCPCTGCCFRCLLCPPPSRPLCCPTALSLFRHQRGSFWLWQENQGPGRRGGCSRKLNTMTI